MVGRVRIHAQGESGTTARLRFAEVLNADGTIYTENLRGASQTDAFTMDSAGVHVWEPHFTFHGFRYVELSGIHEGVTRESLTAIVMHSQMALTGSFECSEPLVNQLQKNIVWGQHGNFFDIPTDCPQRDERLGWLGDAQVFIRTAAFNMDVAPFFWKWLQDVMDAQTPPRRVSGGCTACPHVYHRGRRTCVGGSGHHMPVDHLFDVWRRPHSGTSIRLDAEIFWLFASNFKGPCPSRTRRTSLGRVRRLACPRQDRLVRGYARRRSRGGTPKRLIGTAFFAHAARLLSQIALVLGHEADAAKYQKEFEKIRVAFQKNFVDADGSITGNTQTAYVLALHFDLLPMEQRQAALDRLIHLIQARGMHLATGFVGTPYLNHVLTQGGRSDIAYALLLQQSYPSWLFPVTNGATTIWERWDGWTPDRGFQDAGMNSFNHYAYGAIGDWLYSTVAGINPDPARRRLQAHHPATISRPVAHLCPCRLRLGLWQNRKRMAQRG